MKIQLKTKYQRIKSKGIHFLSSAFFVVLTFLPKVVLANTGDIESSVNRAGEDVYNFFINISFWLGVVMVGLGFVIMKFKFLDRNGKGTSIIINALFGVGGLAAAPAIVEFVRNLFL